MLQQLLQCSFLKLQKVLFPTLLMFQSLKDVQFHEHRRRQMQSRFFSCNFFFYQLNFSYVSKLKTHPSPLSRGDATFSFIFLLCLVRTASPLERGTEGVCMNSL